MQKLLTLIASILAFSVIAVSFTFEDASAHGNVDQSHNFAFTGTVTPIAVNLVGQEFTPTANNIVSVDIQLRSNAQIGQQGFVNATLYQTSVLPGNIIGVAPAVQLTIASTQIVHLDLPSAITLTPGNSYWIVVQSGNPFLWVAQSPGTYTGGTGFVNAIAPVIDFWFITYSSTAAPPQPTIKITKNATNADGAFDFTIFNATNPSNSTVVSIPNTAINNMTAPLTVIPGNYSVTETVPAGWTLDASDCEKNGISLGTTLNFNATLGDSIECIFEDTFVPPPELPTIKITKNATNADGAFDFIIANATNISNSTIVSIPNTAINNMTVPLVVEPGFYNVTETVPPGWTLDTSDCEKNGISLGTTLNFSVVVEDSVECIFVDTFVIPPELPTIKITKNATNADGAFDFIIANATNISNSTIVSIPNTAINNMTVPLVVQPGTFNVTEIVPANWNLISSDCLINGVSQNTTLNFNVTAGDTAECIFENTFVIPPEPPTIKITKNATNADGAFDFTIFNATNPSNSTVVSIPNTAINNMTAPLTVIPGNYSVTETVPPGWTLDASDCEKNSISLGTTLNFNVTLGDSVECIFIDTKMLAEINGLKFNDTNQNGIQDGIEGGVEDIEILLFKLTPPDVIGVLIQNVSTAFDGTYNFTNLDPSSYRVAENPPNGTVQTFPANGQPHFIDILGTETITNINFGNNGTLASEIHGMKFNDTNRNGIQDLGENGIPNFQFSIFPNYQTTFTDSNGNYKFKNLSPGTYSVYEQFLTDTVFTTPRTQTVAVDFNQIVENVDFGDTKTLPLPPDMTIGSGQGETSNGTPLHYPFRDLVIQKTITACTPVGAPLVTLTFPDASVRTNTMTNISGNLWETTFTKPFPNGVAQMRVDIDCPPDTANYPDNPANISGEDVFQIGDIVFYDPSGRVLDACNGGPLEGATTTLLKEFPPTSGNFIIPATTDHLPVDNPQITDADGRYGWDVTPGLYKVVVNKTDFITTESSNVEIPPPVTDLDIILQRVAGCPIFTAKGQRSDVNNFLTYSNPTQTTNSLPTGTTETTIVINYGPTADASTFRATLNKADISGIFKPSPNSSEIVTIQLDEGRNTLNLLIDGLRTDGKTATDRDRLVFIVG